MPKNKFKDVNPEKQDFFSHQGTLYMDQTLKKCLPVRDCLTSGYAIPLWTDLAIDADIENDILHFNWLDDKEQHIQIHEQYQIEDTPIIKKVIGKQAYKFMSPWRIKTPPGYSCLFVSPMYHELPFEILPGIVDTDGMHQVNFPFIYTGKPGKYTAYQGTPLVQVIPFKRDEWKLKISSNDKDDNKQVNSFLGGIYRKLFYNKKKFS
jgi:hypothetical protein